MNKLKFRDIYSANQITTAAKWKYLKKHYCLKYFKNEQVLKCPTPDAKVDAFKRSSKNYLKLNLFLYKWL